jgi:hypothetical protein
VYDEVPESQLRRVDDGEIFGHIREAAEGSIDCPDIEPIAIPSRPIPASATDVYEYRMRTLYCDDCGDEAAHPPAAFYGATDPLPFEMEGGELIEVTRDGNWGTFRFRAPNPGTVRLIRTGGPTWATFAVE